MLLTITVVPNCISMYVQKVWSKYSWMIEMSRHAAEGFLNFAVCIYNKKTPFYSLTRVFSTTAQTPQGWTANDGQMCPVENTVGLILSSRKSRSMMNSGRRADAFKLLNKSKQFEIRSQVFNCVCSYLYKWLEQFSEEPLTQLTRIINLLQAFFLSYEE